MRGYRGVGDAATNCRRDLRWGMAKIGTEDEPITVTPDEPLTSPSEPAEPATAPHPATEPAPEPAHR